MHKYGYYIEGNSKIFSSQYEYNGIKCLNVVKINETFS